MLRKRNSCLVTIATPHCNTLQHTATHCNIRGCCARATRFSPLSQLYSATRCNTLQHAATHCNARECCARATCSSLHGSLTPSLSLLHSDSCSRALSVTFGFVLSLAGRVAPEEDGICRHLDPRLQHTATRCNTLQQSSLLCRHCTTTQCNTLQHTATRCNTPGHLLDPHLAPPFLHPSFLCVCVCVCARTAFLPPHCITLQRTLQHTATLYTTL